MYIPLKVHTHYSIADSTIQASQLAKHFERHEKPQACAIADKGISGCIEFYKEMKKADIKPILGTTLNIHAGEQYNRHVFQAVMLAKTHRGWQEIMKATSDANQQEKYNQYKQPMLELAELEEYSSEDVLLIATSSISELGFVPKYIDYLGVVTQFDKEKARELASLAKKPMVAMPDIHYLNKQEFIDHRVMLANKYKTQLNFLDNKISQEDTHYFYNDFHLMPYQDLRSSHTADEIRNTQVIADQIERFDIFQRPQLPQIDCPDNMSQEGYLRFLCKEGWLKKMKNTIPKDQWQKYGERVNHELTVLAEAGLSSYFLMNKEIVDYGKSKGYFVSARGSAGGCMVSYLLGITDVDPIPPKLLFSRFYNAGRNTKDRVKLADIDLDFPTYARSDIMNFIKDKYGHDKVAQMITFGTLKGSSALTEVLRAWGGIPFHEIKEITKHIPTDAQIAGELQAMKEEFGSSSILQWCLTNEPKKYKDYCYLDNGELQGPLSRRFAQAIRLENTISHHSKHPSGIAVSVTPLSTTCGLIYDNKDKCSITATAMNETEDLGIIKCDILGVNMLDKLMEVRDLVGQSKTTIRTQINA